jgi:hypothetical protein
VAAKGSYTVTATMDAGPLGGELKKTETVEVK